MRKRNPRLEPATLNVGMAGAGALFGALNTRDEQSRNAAAIGYGVAGYLLGSFLTDGHGRLARERPPFREHPPFREQRPPFQDLIENPELPLPLPLLAIVGGLGLWWLSRGEGSGGPGTGTADPNWLPGAVISRVGLAAATTSSLTVRVGATGVDRIDVWAVGTSSRGITPPGGWHLWQQLPPTPSAQVAIPLGDYAGFPAVVVAVEVQQGTRWLSGNIRAAEVDPTVRFDNRLVLWWNRQ